MKAKITIIALLWALALPLVSNAQPNMSESIGLPWYKYEEKDIYIGAAFLKKDINSDKFKMISGLNIRKMTYGFDFGLDYLVSTDVPATYKDFEKSHRETIQNIDTKELDITSLGFTNKSIPNYKYHFSSMLYGQQVDLDRLFQLPNIINRKNNIVISWCKIVQYDCTVDYPRPNFYEDVSQVAQYGKDNLQNIRIINWGSKIQIYSESPFTDSYSRGLVYRSLNTRSNQLSEKERAQLANMNFRIESSHPLDLENINNPLSTFTDLKLKPRIIEFEALDGLNLRPFRNSFW